MVISGDLFNAVLFLVRFCAIQNDCANCPLKDICNKQIQDW